MPPPRSDRYARLSHALVVVGLCLVGCRQSPQTQGSHSPVTGSITRSPTATSAANPAKTIPVGEEPLVDLTKLDRRIVFDIRYATANNFMGRVLYPEARALLRESVARRLSAVQDELAGRGLGLKVYDAYRPWSIQKLMWQVMPDEDYVANPKKGSRHNRGAAVDVTLVDAAGRELEMPSGYDEFTERAHASYAGGLVAARRNRDLLIEVMGRQGFAVLPTEWWHFDAPGWERYSVLDVPLTKDR